MLPNPSLSSWALGSSVYERGLSRHRKGCVIAASVSMTLTLVLLCPGCDCARPVLDTSLHSYPVRGLSFQLCLQIWAMEAQRGPVIAKVQRLVVGTRFQLSFVF